MNVLVIAAHPDDEVLGVGGAAARHAQRGDAVHVLVVCEGAGRRYPVGRLTEIAAQARRAAAHLGVANVTLGDLPDQGLDTLPLTQVAAVVEAAIARLAPATVYTHHRGDLNRDHQILAEAVLVATRPYAAPSVREVLCFETPSSTEWGAAATATTFEPNVYIDIGTTLEAKLAAFAEYAAEVREYPHPRSLQALRERAAYRGSVAGVRAAEAFVLVRALR